MKLTFKKFVSIGGYPRKAAFALYSLSVLLCSAILVEIFGKQTFCFADDDGSH